MIIKEFATKIVETLPVTATIQQAALRMKERGVGGLPVVDGAEVVGFVTDRDLVVRGLALGVEPKQASIDALMTRKPVQILDTEEVVAAIEMMKLHGVRRLMLVDHQNRLSGIVSIGDLARSPDCPARLVNELLQVVCDPAEPTPAYP